MSDPSPSPESVPLKEVKSDPSQTLELVQQGELHSDPSPPPESVPLREINADEPSHEPHEPEDDPGAETGEEVHEPSHTGRAGNLPVCCANIRNFVRGALDVIPMPASARTYLKNRWLGTFIATISFLLLALIGLGFLIFVAILSPEDDSIADWQKSVSSFQDSTVFDA